MSPCVSRRLKENPEARTPPRFGSCGVNLCHIVSYRIISYRRLSQSTGYAMQGSHRRWSARGRNTFAGVPQITPTAIAIRATSRSVQHRIVGEGGERGEGTREPGRSPGSRAPPMPEAHERRSLRSLRAPSLLGSKFSAQ